MSISSYKYLQRLTDTKVFLSYLNFIVYLLLLKIFRNIKVSGSDVVLRPYSFLAWQQNEVHKRPINPNDVRCSPSGGICYLWKEWAMHEGPKSRANHKHGIKTGAKGCRFKKRKSRSMTADASDSEKTRNVYYSPKSRRRGQSVSRNTQMTLFRPRVLAKSPLCERRWVPLWDTAPQGSWNIDAPVQPITNPVGMQSYKFETVSDLTRFQTMLICSTSVPWRVIGGQTLNSQQEVILHATRDTFVWIVLYYLYYTYDQQDSVSSDKASKIGVRQSVKSPDRFVFGCLCFCT